MGIAIKPIANIEIAEKDVLTALAIYLYLKKEISLGKAAEICEISKWEFLELLSKLGISVIDYSEEELEEEACR
jgi:predicted HTH domain antitoxin